MNKMIEKLYKKKINASGLAVFRVIYSLIFLKEIYNLFYFKNLIFDEIPFIKPYELDFSIPLIIWMIVISCITLGLFTRIMTIINYLFTLLFISTLTTYEYHVFYAYIGINLLLIFTQVSKVGSLDRLLLKLKYSNTRFLYKPERNISVINYLIYPLLGIGFIYFDSMYFKLNSKLWLDGLGVWLPASMPFVAKNNLTVFLNLKWFMLFLGYLTLVFEFVFIFLFFRKKWRLPLLIIGVFLHFGIYIAFPIPLFGFTMMALYIFLIPVKFWSNLSKKLKSPPRITFYYDEECPLCVRTKIIITHLDFFGFIEFKGVQTYSSTEEKLKKFNLDQLLNNIYSVDKKGNVYSGINTYKKVLSLLPLLFPIGLLLHVFPFSLIGKKVYRRIADKRIVERCTEDNCGYKIPEIPSKDDTIKILSDITLEDIKIKIATLSILVVFLFQFNISFINKIPYHRLNNPDIPIVKFIKKTSKNIAKFGSKITGIYHHGVFTNSHFNSYNHIISIQAVLPNGEKVWLPTINKNGMPAEWNSGPVHTKCTFRINGPIIDTENLNNGIRDLTSFWAHKNGYNLEDMKFEISIKKIETPEDWEKDFLQKQINKPWQSGGYIKWKNKQFKSYIVDIEKI